MIAMAIEGSIKGYRYRSSGLIEGDMNGTTLGISKGMMELLCFTFYSKASTKLQGLVFKT